MLKGRVDRLAADPEDTELLVESITLYHMIIEGALALTGQHFIIEYNEEQKTLPGFVEGFQNVARDEHRHIAFGVRFLTDMAKQDDALPRGDSAHDGRGAADRRPGPRSSVGRGGRLGPVRILP